MEHQKIPLDKWNNNTSKFLLIFILLISISCKDKFSHNKYYEFIVENQLTKSTVKIVPDNKSDFWLIPDDTIKVVSGERIIIGTKIHYDDNKKIVDIYKTSDLIESFNIFIDTNKIENNLTKREFWNFEKGSVDESAFYILRIDKDILK